MSQKYKRYYKNGQIFSESNGEIIKDGLTTTWNENGQGHETQMEIK